MAAASADLVLNAGSSSVKFALFGAPEGGNGGVEAPHPVSERLVSGKVEIIDDRLRLSAHDPDGKPLVSRELPAGPPEHAAENAIKALMGWLGEHVGLDRLRAVGHRIVHGGTDFVGPVLVTAEVLAKLRALIPLDPLHQPACIEPIAALARSWPDLPQVACFDTAFHATMPEVARALPLPRSWRDAGLRRYGFHGLAYEHIARRLARLYPALGAGRVVVAHIGSGASLCAMRQGVSVETTMSFTSLDGLVMSTRSGTIDPGALLYLLREHKLDAAGLEDLLYHHSGLLGLSGLSGDMRTLRGHAGEPAVRLALDVFTYRFAQLVGQMVSVLQGVDGIVFTGGIGENDAAFRRDACARLAWLGLSLDVGANESGGPVISAPESRVKLLVIPADEEISIHRHMLACLKEA